MQVDRVLSPNTISPEDETSEIPTYSTADSSTRDRNLDRLVGCQTIDGPSGKKIRGLLRTTEDLEENRDGRGRERHVVDGELQKRRIL